MTIRLFELEGMGEGEVIDLVFGGDLFADTSSIAEHIHNMRCAHEQRRHACKNPDCDELTAAGEHLA